MADLQTPDPRGLTASAPRWLPALVAGAILAGAGALAAVWLDAREDGLLAFHAWTLMSGKAHGGRFADVNGVRLYYETYGAGPPVLVLHGGGGDHESMRRQIVALADEHLVIAPDTRGHGRSGDVARLHYDDMAMDADALLGRLGVAKADVVGWSDGGIAGLVLAVRRPGRVRRLVVIGANYDVAGGGDFATAGPDPNAPPLWDKLRELWRTEPNLTAADLARISSPTLVMAGERDVIPRWHTDAMARAIPGSRERIIAGADHAGPLERPDLENREILAFLRGR